MRHEEINIHQRKRQSGKKGLEPYPSRKQKYKLVDKIVSVTAVIYPLTLLPQLYQIWSTENAQGVSLLTWFLLLIFTLPLVAYAFLHEDKKLTLMYSSFFLIYILIVLGIVLFS
jgi:uncharacterized protein with PQ loop repeat